MPRPTSRPAVPRVDATASLTGPLENHRALCLGLHAEARRDYERAAKLYGYVAGANGVGTPPHLIRAALRRGAYVALRRGEPSRAVHYLRRHLRLTESLPVATRACAEHDLIAALAANGHEHEARVVLSSSSIVVEELSPPERVERLRVCLQLGMDPDRVLELTDLSELSATSAVSILLDAVEGREIEEASALFEALAVAIARVNLDDARGIDEKRLVRCGGQYERASRAADAAACWRVVWLQRKNSREANHPKAQATLRQVTRLTGHSNRPHDPCASRTFRRLRTISDRFRGRRER